MKKLCFISGVLFFSVLMVVAPGCSVDKSEKQEGEVIRDLPEKPVITGESVHIFNPNDTRSHIDTTWYTNDHCFAKGPDGVWHAYGIIGRAPIDAWTGETNFFHVSSPVLYKQKWEDHEYALVAKEGEERVLWAPFIFKENGVYNMFYNIGNMQEDAPNYNSWGQLCLATSKDMFNWERHERNPLFSDYGHGRDAYILKHKDTYYFYYTRTYSEIDHRSCIAVRKGHSLTEWSGPKRAHVQPQTREWGYGGEAESPAVIYKDGIFYLFICRSDTDYNRTDVYWSKDPEDFPRENLVTSLPVHATEVIYDENEGWFVSNTGFDKKGIYIAPIEWR